MRGGCWKSPLGFIADQRQKAGLVAVTGSEMHFFPKAVFETQILRTVHGSSQARRERSSQRHPNPPSPARAFTGLPFTLRTGMKRWDFNQFGGVSPEQHISAAFCSPPIASVLLSRQQRSAGRHCAGVEADFSTTIEITGPFSYTVIFLFRALNTER